MISIKTEKMRPVLTVDGCDLSELRAICRYVANETRDFPLRDISKGFAEIIDGACKIAQTETTANNQTES
jgi:hypothetical protein